MKRVAYLETDFRVHRRRVEIRNNAQTALAGAGASRAALKDGWKLPSHILRVDQTLLLIVRPLVFVAIVEEFEARAFAAIAGRAAIAVAVAANRMRGCLGVR